MRFRKSMAESAPCVGCYWAPFCRTTEMTCSTFRAWVREERVRPGHRQEPDKSWDDSWPEEEVKNGTY